MIETSLGALLGWGLGSNLGNFFNSFRTRKVASQRLEEELAQMDDPDIPDNFYAWQFPEDDEFVVHCIVVVMDAYSVYYGGTFLIDFHFHDCHPMKPPNVQFLTPLHHVNVGKSSILSCSFPLLYEQWNPQLTIASLLSEISELISHPTIDPECRFEKAQAFQSDPELFEEYARYLAVKFAWNPLAYVLASRSALNKYPLFLRLNSPCGEIQRKRSPPGGQQKELEQVRAYTVEMAEKEVVPWAPKYHNTWAYKFDAPFRSTVRVLFLLHSRVCFEGNSYVPCMLSALAKELLCVVCQYLSPHSIPRCILNATHLDDPAYNLSLRLSTDVS
jgi:ubiquitin-protein ligase